MVKTLAIICCLIVLAITMAEGQSKSIELGLIGGPSISSLRGNEVKEYKNPTIGFTAGIYMHYTFSKHLSFCVNLAYERKGSVWDGEVPSNLGGPPEQLVVHSNFNYLTLPVLFRISYGNKNRVFINAGPFFGYLMEQITVKTSTDKQKKSYYNTEYFNPFDMGFSLGLGVSFQIIKKICLSVEIRDNLGLNNISNFPMIENETIKTNSVNLLLTIAHKF